MGRIFYWKGQTGSARNNNANTALTNLNYGHKYYISAANNWNNASNWALDIGQTGDSGYDEGAGGGSGEATDMPRYMITPETWPKAGDSVVFDKLTNVFLDGATGSTGETYPYTECLFGGTTNDYKWFDGSSTAGKLEKLTIEKGYEEQLYSYGAAIGWDPHGNDSSGVGARLGIDMVHGKVATYGASGPNEGLGLYVAEMIDNGISGPSPVHYDNDGDLRYWYDWSRERSFTTNFRCDQLYVNGAANYSFYQDELKRGCTINRIHMDRNWNDMADGLGGYYTYRRRAFFRMFGDSVNYEIASLYQDTSRLSNQNMITSRTEIPNVVIAPKERNSVGSGMESHEIVAQVATAKIYPGSLLGASGGSPYDRTAFSQKDGWTWTGNGWGITGPEGEPVPYDQLYPWDIEASLKLHSVRFYGLRSGISGASGPGVSNYQGVSIGHLYMYDSNPYYISETGSVTGGEHEKNFNTVCLDISHPSFGGGTVSNIYAYGGALNLHTGGCTASVPCRILSGEMNNKVVIRGFDPANLQYRGFEIAGHTLGIDGANHGILHLTEACDVRLGKGARIASTTAKADVDTVLTTAQVFSTKGGGK